LKRLAAGSSLWIASRPARCPHEHQKQIARIANAFLRTCRSKHAFKTPKKSFFNKRDFWWLAGYQLPAEQQIGQKEKENTPENVGKSPVFYFVTTLEQVLLFV